MTGGKKPAGMPVKDFMYECFRRDVERGRPHNADIPHRPSAPRALSTKISSRSIKPASVLQVPLASSARFALAAANFRIAKPNSRKADDIG